MATWSIEKRTGDQKHPFRTVLGEFESPSELLAALLTLESGLERCSVIHRSSDGHGFQIKIMPALRWIDEQSSNK